jgi:hypothetical protein
MNYRVLLGLFLASAPGCTVDAAGDGGGDRAPVGVSSGSLVLDWTIDGSKDPEQCDQSASDTIDITVTASDGSPAGEFQQSCRALATTIDLAPGSYSAEVVLLDSSGHDRTTSLHVRSFDILGGDQLSVAIDFDADSFVSP